MARDNNTENFTNDYFILSHFFNYMVLDIQYRIYVHEYDCLYKNTYLTEQGA